MPEYAGEISLKASIEKKEFYASLLEMKNKLGELTKYSKPIKLSINFKKLNLSNIDSAIQDITQKYNNLVKGLEKPPEEIGIAKAFRKAEADLAKLISKRDRLVSSIGGENNLEIVGRGVKQGRIDESTLPAEYSKIKDLEKEIEKSKGTVKDLAETLNAVRLNPELLPSVKNLQSYIDDLNKKKIQLIDEKEITKANSLKKAISGAFDNISSKAQGILGGIGNTLSSGLSKALSPLKALSSGVSNLFKRIGRLGLLVTVFSALRHGFSALRQYIGGVLSTNTTFMNSLNQIRSNLLTAFYPIYQAVLPALNALMAMLSKATSYLAGFVSVIFGKNIKQSQAGAKALNDSIAQVNQTTTKSTAVSNKKAKAVKNEKKAYDELGKGIKKAKGELASFDKLNVLEKHKKDESQDIDNSAPDTPNVNVPVFTPTIEFSDSEMSQFETIFEKIKKLIEPTIDAFKKLGETFKETFGKFAIRVGQDFLDEFLYPLGRWAFNDALPRFAKITEDMLKNIDWDKLNKALKEFFRALEPFAEQVGNGLLWFYENVLAKLATYTINNLLPPFIRALSASIKIISKVLDGISDTFKWFFETALEKLKEAKVPDKLKEFFEKFADSVEKIAKNKDALKELGEYIGANLIAIIGLLIGKSAAKGLTGLFAILSKIGALLTPQGLIVAGCILVAGTLIYLGKKLYDSKKAWEKFYEDVGMSKEEFSKLSVEEQGKMVDEWLNKEREFTDESEKLEHEHYKKIIAHDKKYAETIMGIQKKFVDIIKTIGEKWDGFFVWLGYKIKGFTDRLENWGRDAGKAIAEGAKNAWKAVGDVAKGIWNEVLKAIQDKINKFIKDINWVINAIKVFPGTDFLKPLPEVKIPGLAQGAVLKGGNPMLAYLNDQPRGQINIETPLNTMIDAFNTALQNNSYAGNITIEANGDIDSIVSLLNFRIKKENSRIGTRLISGDAWI